MTPKVFKDPKDFKDFKVSKDPKDPLNNYSCETSIT